MGAINEVNVGIVGAGAVGSSVIECIQKSQEKYFKKTGVLLNVASVYTRTPDSKRTNELYKKHPELFADRVEDVIQNYDLNVLVETVGGKDGFALDVIEKSLNDNLPVVTANKDLIATHGKRLLELAQQKNTPLNFEAAVAGGIPIVNVLQNGLVGNPVQKLEAIANGTCNFILTELYNNPDSEYAQALKVAQDKDYAESDPTNDVEGIDTAYKAIILAYLAFGVWIDFEDIKGQIEGISGLTKDDFDKARKDQTKIKLLASITSDSIEVSPENIDATHALYGVDDVNNGVQVTGAYGNPYGFSGPGAGGPATASAIISDIINQTR